MAEISYAVPLLKEDHVSQVPALQLLQNLGWQYLTPKKHRHCAAEDFPM